jgi:hypothetical protein
MTAVEIYFKIRDRYQSVFIDNFGKVFKKEISPTVPCRTYELLEKRLPIVSGELLIVLRSHATEHRHILSRIVSCCKNFRDTENTKIGKVWFFVEDLIKFDVSGNLREMQLIKEIIKQINNDYQIYHCEFTSDLPYFDWYVSEQIFGIFLPKKQDISFDFSNKLCCLNNRFDPRRYVISSWLATKEGVDYSQYHNFSVDDVKSWNIVPRKHEKEILMGAEVLSNIHLHDMLPLDYISDTAVTALLERTKNSFCSLVTESRYDTGWPNFSEKTLRVIYCARPFILSAPPGTLKLLKNLGIQTFSDYWDESYDDEQDPKKRLSMIIDSAISILRHPDLKSMLEDMSPVLIHNQQTAEKIMDKMLTISDIKSARSL